MSDLSLLWLFFIATFFFSLYSITDLIMIEYFLFFPHITVFAHLSSTCTSENRVLYPAKVLQKSPLFLLLWNWRRTRVAVLLNTRVLSAHSSHIRAIIKPSDSPVWHQKQWLIHVYITWLGRSTLVWFAFRVRACYLIKEKQFSIRDASHISCFWVVHCSVSGGLMDLR